MRIPRLFIHIAPAVIALAMASAPAHAGVEAKVERLEDYTRYTLTLKQALPDGHTLVVHLGRQNGQFRQAWAEVPETGTVADKVNTDDLVMDDGRLKGMMEVWVDAGGARQCGRYEIDLPVDGDTAEGDYEGTHAPLERTLVFDRGAEGIVTPDQVRFFVHGDTYGDSVHGRVQAPAAPDQPARFYLQSRHLLKGSLSSTRYVDIQFDLRNGEVENLSVHPRTSKWTSATWQATVKEHDFTFDGDGLEGSITVEISGGSPRTDDGVYSFDIELDHEQGLLTGRAHNVRKDNEAIRGSPMVGKAEGLDAIGGNRHIALFLREAIALDDHLYVVIPLADGALQDGWAVRPGLPDRFDVDVGDLSYDDGRLTGTMAVRLTSDSPVVSGTEDMNEEYELDVRSTEAEPDRTVPLFIAYGDEQYDIGGQSHMTGSYEVAFGEPSRVTGAVAVEVSDAEQLAQRYAIAEGMDWPAWNGPHGTFSAPLSGHELVESLDDARLLWKSEHTPPGRMQVRRYGAEGTSNRYLDRGGPAGGGSSPIIADGIVYFYYLQPDLGSDDLAGHVDDWVKEGRRTFGAHLWANEGEDVFVAIDGATGKSLWKTVVPGGEYDYTGKINYTAKPAVGGGRLYVRAKNRTLGLDAETGELLWVNAEHGGRIAVALEDMAVFSGEHVTALDADTGELHWRIEDAGEDTSAPLHWKHEGESYIISGNSAGRVVCIRAADGELMWEIDDAGDNSYSMALGEQHLLLNAGGRGGGDPDRLGAYRITPDGAAHVWTLDAEYSHQPSRGAIPAVDGGYVYLQVDGGSSSVLKIDIRNGQILDESTVPRRTGGHLQKFDDRLLIQKDARHGSTPLVYYRAVDKRLERLGGTWHPPHGETSSYSPLLTTHAIADGRVFIRGQRGIYCYDLRKQD